MHLCSDKNHETQSPSSCSDGLQVVRTSGVYVIIIYCTGMHLQFYICIYV